MIKVMYIYRDSTGPQNILPFNSQLVVSTDAIVYFIYLFGYMVPLESIKIKT